MIRLLLAVIVAALSLPAFAQGVTKDCVTTACTLVSDALSPVPAGPPTACRLYSGATLLAEAPVAAPYACSFSRTFAAGTYTVTARYVNVTGEGPNSNAVTFTSAAPIPLPPPPPNFRFQ